MSNAAKLKKKAAEFEQKKQFDKALQLYIQILDEGDDDEGEGDVALYNRVGDLLMRQGNVGDAMTYYEKAVDLYAESGFFNNAIALCNKILRQSPGRNSVYYKLGKISAKKGFISDAKQNFLEYASRMQSGGHLDEAFRALKEFADLCPDQDDIRLMLAEQLSKKDRKKEALEQLQLLYEKFEAEGRGEDMRATVSRMRSIDPAAEPKTGSGVRNQKSADLVFLDLSDGASPAGAPPGRGQDKSRGGPPSRRSGDARKTVPVVAEPEPDEAPMDLQLSDQGAESLALPEAEAEAEDDLLPLPPLEEPPPVVEGFESDSQRASETAAERERVTGFEPSALDDELSQALDAALPDVEPPLSGQQFAALRLSTPLNVPTLMPPEHDLALPGQLPPIGAGGRSMLSLTNEMELIIPDSEDPVSSPSRSGAGTAVPLRSQPPFHGAAPDAPANALPLIEVDAGSRQAPPPSTPRSDGLTFVGGAELLDVPDLDTESEDATPPPSVREPVSKRPSSRVHRGSPGDEATSLAGWLHEDTAPPAGGANGSAPPADALPDLSKAGATGSRRRSDAVSHSALARSVDTLKEQVQSEPSNWQLRRQLAEALLDAGERDAGIQVLEAAMVGLERSQDLEGARSVADEIIRLIPNSVRHHQKRVEYAFRTSDRSRLPQAYLELADALFRSGQADKARAVYSRVLELSPDDPRAQAALSTFGDDFIEPLDLPESDLLDPEGPATDEDATEVLPLARPPQSPSAAPKAEGRPGVRGGAAPSAVPAVPGRGGLRMPPPGPATLPEPLEPPDGPLDLRPIRPEQRSGKGSDASAIGQPEQKPAGKGEPRLPGRGGRVPAQDAKPGAKPNVRPNPPGGPPAGGAPSSGAARLPAKGPAVPQRPAGGLTIRPDAGDRVASPAASEGMGRDYVNLGDWLRDDEGPRSLRMVVEDEKPTGDEAADFADMLRKFKQGIAENVSEEDHESHYDLGVAYKEMGLVDEAIAEFQKALRGKDRVRTYEALGQCFMEKEQFTVAATILARALSEPGVTDDQLVGVLYLLGYASEALMRWEAAVGYYQRVFAVDIRFRDAAERLAAIERTSR